MLDVKGAIELLSKWSNSVKNSVNDSTEKFQIIVLEFQIMNLVLEGIE